MATAQHEKEPQRGDLIEFLRGAYEHWAVYVGDGFIVHMTSADSKHSSSSSFGSAPNKKAIVKKEKLSDVEQECSWQINNSLDGEHDPRDPDLIVREAEWYVGKEQEYNVLTYNCEHFVKRLRYGKRVSGQVRKALNISTPVFDYVLSPQLIIGDLFDSILKD